MADSTIVGSCTCQPGCGCSSGYSRSARPTRRPAVDAEGGHLDCGRADIDADDDLSLSVHVTVLDAPWPDQVPRRRTPWSLPKPGSKMSRTAGTAAGSSPELAAV